MRIRVLYGPEEGQFNQAVQRLLKAAGNLLYRLSPALLESMVFSAFLGAAIRPIVSRVFRAPLEALGRHFHAAFYASQFSNQRRRRRVARAPLLHYFVIGWTEARSPAPEFDPVFYRQANPEIGPTDDPFLHYLGLDAGQAAVRNASARQALAWKPGQDTVLTIHHGRQGGSSRFLDLFEQDMWRNGRNVLRLRAVVGAPELATVDDTAADAGEGMPTEVFDLASERARLVDFARRRDVTRLLVNHLIDRPPAMMDWIEELSASLGCSYDVILHDYFALCPRVNLVTGLGKFCGVAPLHVCVQCVADHGSDVPDVDARVWRPNFLSFLSRADRVIVPSDDMASRMGQYVAKPIEVWAPERDLDLPRERPPRLTQEEPLRIVILGVLSVVKGLQVVVALARAARLAGEPLSFTVLGPSADTDSLAKEGVAVTGPYAAENLDRLLEAVAPHVVFLPAIWPETWSFVLTSALRRGLPVVAFDLGASAERLRRLGRGHILPLELSTRPDDLLAAFRSLRTGWIQR